MNPIPNLRVESLNVAYGDLQVLWDVSFKAEDRKIVTLIGSNGAGKTTTLKTIAGLLKPKSGRILIDGLDLARMNTSNIVENAAVVYVPEGRGIFQDMSVKDNLDMGSYTGHARKFHEKTLSRVYSLFPILEARRSQSAGTLSGGEAQMLAIGRGLMSLPKLLMLDEPSAGLAPIVVDSIFDAISRLRDEEGITILMVEQDAGRALRLCDHSYVLETGRVRLSGSGGELLNNEYVKQAYLSLAE